MAANHGAVNRNQRGVQDVYGVQMKVFMMMCEARQTHFP